MNLKISKPICFFDLETTGVNVSLDRIVEISILKVFPNGNKESKTWLVNPGIPIPSEASNIHGITNDIVKNEPNFKIIAPDIKAMIHNCDLAGFNVIKFDIPLLMEEGNYRSSEDIYMGGVDIFNFALREVPTIVDEHLRDLNKTKDNIDLLVLHQANKFMVNYLRKIIKINKEKVPIEVDNYGNTGPCSIPLVLSIKGNNYKKENKLKSVMMCGFGVGLSWGTAMTNLENTIFYKPVEI